MKINHRPYGKNPICHGCEKEYIINAHLLICDKIVLKNYEYLTAIRTIFNKHEIYDYKTEDFFTDYGLKKFV